MFKRLWQCAVCDVATRDPERNRWKGALLKCNDRVWDVWICPRCHSNPDRVEE